MSNRFYEFLSRAWQVTVMLSLAIVGGSVLFWSLDKKPPLTIGAVTVEKAQVKRGGFLRIDYEVSIHRICAGDLQRLIIDSRDVLHFIEPYMFTQRTETPNEIGGKNTRISVPIPLGASEGPARYQATIRYYCNPLQRFLNWPIEVMTPVLEFEIVPDDTPAVYRQPEYDYRPVRPSLFREVSAAHALASTYSAVVREREVDAEDRRRGCRTDQTRVKPYYRYINGKLKFVRDHCRGVRSPPA